METADHPVTQSELRAGLAELETRIIKEINSRDWRLVGFIAAASGLIIAANKFL